MLIRAKYFVCFVGLLALTSAFIACSKKTNVVGEYKYERNRRTADIIHLDKDSTGYYTWWTDLKMFNKGTWFISNDSLFFKDQSLLHPEDKVFRIERNKLIEANGTVWKHMNFIQRKRLYRGR